MGLSKEEVLVQYYLAKQKIRMTCVEKCINIKNDKEGLNSEETQCLEKCGSRIHSYMVVLSDVYKENFN